MHTKISSNIIKTITVLFFTLMSFSSVLGQSNLDFSYSGTYSEVTLQPGTYELEVWGAQGGGGIYHYGPGGKGGYSKGVLDLTVSETLYIYVGQKGFQSGTTNTAFNGGGAGSRDGGTNIIFHGFTGGGATHIAKKMGVLSTLNSFQSDVLIVAGGGGGGGGNYSYLGSGYDPAGGAGGGIAGLAGAVSTASSYRGSGNGGTQTAGGATGVQSNSTPSVAATFGLGASADRNTADSAQGGGGGGGWYGGGAGSFAGGAGGGGSGYIGGVTSGTMSTGTRNGDGFARITELRGNVTIVASGVEGADINNGWTYSDGLIKVGSNVSINASVIENYLSSGDLTIDARSITVNSPISYTGITERSLTFKSLNYIDVNASVKATGSGELNIILWSDQSAIGGVDIGGYIDLALGVELISNGGTLVLAGGEDNGANGGTASDGIPDGYAWNSKTTSHGGILLGPADGTTGSSVNLLSDGGDIIIRGKTSGSIEYPGILSAQKFIINSGSGTILMDGDASLAHGIELAYGSNANYAITSNSTESPAISITGSTQRSGYTGAIFSLREGAYLIESRAISGGGIQIKGGNTNSSGNEIYFNGDASNNAYILSKNGPIEILSSSNSTGGVVFTGNTYFGGASASTVNGFSSSVTSSSSSISLDSDYFTFNGQTAVTTSGAFSMKPTSDSFGEAQTISNLLFSGNESTLNIGKPENTATVNLSSDIEINGPISIYAGTISLNANISTTFSGADILTKATGDISLATSKSITTNGGDIILWANSDGQTSNGSVLLRDDSVINTAGGGVWIGGGSGNTTWNDITVGNGYAVAGTSITPSDGGSNVNAGVYFENATIQTNGGDILVKGDGGTNLWGIVTYGGNTINSGSGTIEWDGKTSSAGPDPGILFGLHDIVIPANTSFNSTSTDVAVKLKGSSNTGNGIGVDGIVTIESSGSGSIDLTGTGASPHYGIEVGNYYNGSKLNLYAASGEIKVDGGSMGISVVQTGNQGNALGDSKLTIGQGGTISSSTSNIKLVGDAFSVTNTNGLNINASGQLSVLSQGNSFSGPLSWPLTNSTVSNITGLTIGKETNTSNITIGSDQTVAGPISIYGRDIALSANLTSTLSGADILTKASGDIVLLDNKSIETNLGNVILWSDSDTNNEGSIVLSNNVEINTVNGSTASNLNTGGKIVLAGGLDDGSNGGTASDGIPDGFASSSFGNGIKLGTTEANETQMYSGGGDIVIRGFSNHSSTNDNRNEVGVWHTGSWVANSGNGSIHIIGKGDNLYGVNFVRSTAVNNVEDGPKFLSFISNKASGAAITISGTSNTSHGVVFNYNNPKEILATGGGNISITGSGAGSGYGIFLQNPDILSSGGSIKLDGGTKGIYVADAGSHLGAKTGSSITNSTSNITLIADVLNFIGASNILTSGTLTVEPSSNSFSGAFSWPIANSTVSNITGLTIGKETNTSNITITSDQAIAGPISIYGGDIEINNSLDTSLGSGGDILLKASGDIVVLGNKSIKTNLGNVILWSDSDGNDIGGVLFNSGSQISTNNGHVWIGGGSGSILWNSLNVGNSYAANLTTPPTGLSETYAGINAIGSYINAGSGDLFMSGRSFQTNYRYGIGTRINGMDLTANDISIYGVGSSNNNSSSDTNRGNWGVGIENISITTVSNGNILINGVGGGANSGTNGGVNHGVYMNSNSSLLANGSGDIAISGTGGGNSSITQNTNNDGIHLNGADISNDSGEISLTASKGVNNNSEAIYITNMSLGTIDNITTSSGTIDLLNADTLTLGSINATDEITIETLTGDINLTDNILTTSTSTDAIILNAGKSSSAGTTTGGDIKLINTPTLTAGTNGIIKLFSGSETQSTGLAAIADNNYFGLDETSSLPTFTTGTTNAIYRGTGNNALYTDGSNDYVELSSSPISDGATEFTIELWIKPDGTNFDDTEYHGFIGYGLEGTTKRNPSLWLKEGKVHLDSYRDGDLERFDFLTDRALITQDAWTHIAFVKDAEIYRVYLDGELAITAAAPDKVNIHKDTYLIGHVNNYFSGQIDEVRFWSDVRTKAEIDALMNIEATGSEPGLVAYYDFNHGSPSNTNTGITTLVDRTNNSNNGTLNNFSLTGNSSNWVNGFFPKIIGERYVYLGKTRQLSHFVSGGTWSVDNNSLANISSTGVLTGVSAGQVAVTYTVNGNSTTDTFDIVDQNNLGTLTIVASGGVTENNGWVYSNGVIRPTSSSAVNIDASSVLEKLNLNHLTIEASSISVNANVSSTYVNNLTLKASANITQASSVDITTNGGDVVYWSDSDASGSISSAGGTIALLNTSSITSNGGDVILGGGADANADGIPDGYATGAFTTNTRGATNATAGVSLDNSIINSGVGNVIIKGQGTGALQNFQMGTRLYGGSISGKDINIAGIGSIYGSSSSSWGLSLEGFSIEGSGNIVLTGKGGQAGQSNSDYNQVGVEIRKALDNDGNHSQISATNTGTILINGQGGSGPNANHNNNNSYAAGIRIDVDQTSPIHSVNGNITLNGTSGYSGRGSGVIIGSPITSTSGNVTLKSLPSIEGTTNLNGDIEINASITTGGGITLESPRKVTQTAALTGDSLGLFGTATFTLTHTSNDINTLAAGSSSSPIGALSYTDADDLTIGSVNPTGIYSSGAIELSTLSGDLKVTEPIVSTQATGDAVKLYADKDATTGNLGDGQIKITNNGSITIESGARALLYSGKEVESTGVQSEVGGENNVRTGVDANTNLSTLDPVVASTGKYGLMRVTSINDNANLLSLTTSAGTLSPVFDSETMEYSVVLGAGTSSVNFTPTTDDTSATLKINGTSHTSGTAYTASNLMAYQLYTIEVTASDGIAKKTYKLAVRVTQVTVPSPTGVWRNLFAGENFDPNDDQQATADTDLVGNTTDAMMQAQQGTYSFSDGTIDKVYYFRVRLGNENAPKTSFYYGMDVDNDYKIDFVIEANLKDQTPYVAYHAHDPSKDGSGPSMTAWENDSNDTNIERELGARDARILSYATVGESTTVVDIDGPVGGKNSGDDTWLEFAFTESSFKSWTTDYLGTELTGGDVSGLVAFTSTSQTANGDIGGINDKTADMSLTWRELGNFIESNLDEVTSYTLFIPTVVSQTSNTQTPTVTGTWGGSNEGDDTLVVTIGGVTYTVANGLTINGSSWSVVVTTSLTEGTYAISATATRTSDGSTKTDSTTDELEIKLTTPLTSTDITTGTIADLVYTGQAQTPTLEVKDGTTVLTQDNDYTLSYSDNINVGTATVTITGTGNYSGTKQVTFDITTKSLTITGLTGDDKVYDNTASSTASGTASLLGVEENDDVSLGGSPDFTFTSSNVGTGITINTTGYTISGADSGNYTLTQPTLSADITAKELTITGLTGDDKVYDNTTSATASGTASLLGVEENDDVSLSGTPVFTFSSSNVGTDITINTTGYTISEADAGNYTLTQPTLSADITAKELTITGLTGDDKVYDNKASATASGTASLLGVEENDDVSLGGTPDFTFASSNVGTGITINTTGYTISGADAGNYTLTQPTLSADITAKVLTITADDKSKGFGEADPALTVSYTGFVNDGDQDDLSGTLSISRATGEAANTYAITASGLTATNYAITYVAGTFTIASKSITSADITTATIADLVYTGQAQTPTLAVKDGTTVLTQATDYTLSYVDNTNVGTATVTITGTGDYSGTKTVTFTITKASLTITADDKSKGFGEADPTLTVSYTGFVNDEDQDDLSGTLSISRATGEAANTYAITASGLTATNYAITYVAGTFTIASKSITSVDITTATIADLVYTGQAQTPTLAVKDGTTVLTQATDYTLSYSDNINVGTATVTITGTGDYSGTKAVTFTITKASLTITADDKSKGFGESDPTLTASYAGFVSGEDQDDLSGTLLISRATGEAANIYAITASGLTATNYAITYVAGTFTIASKSITSADITTATIADLVYTGQAQTPTLAVKDGTTVLTQATDYTLSYVDNINVGTATVTITGTGDYSGTKTIIFTILKKTLTISGLTADDKEYDGTTEATLSGTATLVGLAVGDDVVLSGIAEGTFTSPDVSTDITVNVVGYEITGTAKDNYSLRQPTGLSAGITQRTISVAPSTGLTKQYGEADPEFTYIFSGSISGQTAAFSGSLSRDQGEAVDQYEITQGSLVLANNGSFNSSNYAIELTANIDFEITKAPLLITVNNDAKFVTQADAEGYAGVSYTGFKFGEDSSVLVTDNLRITRSNAGVESAGIYQDVLQASGLSSSNYEIRYESGNYQIVAADQLYVKLSDSEIVYGETPTYRVELSGYYSSGNTQVVDLTSSTSVTGNKITVVDGASGSATFLIVPETPLYSTSNHLSVGTYNLVSDQAVFTSSNFNNTLIEQGVLKVNPKELVVSLSSSKSKIYDGNALLPSMTFDLSTPFVTDNVLASGTGVYSSANVGDRAYTVSGLMLSGSDANNYYIQGGANVQITGTNGQISKQTLTVTPRIGQSKIFGTSDPILTYDYRGQISGETPLFSGSLGRLSGESRGSYAIRQGSLLLEDKDAFLASNYQLDFTSGIAFTITNKLLSDQDISILPISDLIYNGQSQAPNTALKDVDTVLVEGEDYEVSYINNTDVGKATITLTGLGNYGGVRTVTFNIIPRVLTVTPDANQTKIYGDADPSLTYTFSGLVSGETPGFTNTISRAVGEHVGTYQINQGSLLLIDNAGFKADNYQIDLVTGVEFTITKAALTITVHNDSKFVTQQDADGYAGVNYSGFKFGEDQTVLNTTNLIITRSNASEEAVGVYTAVLAASGVSSQNYDITYQKGDYTIIGADQLVVKLKDSEVVYGATPVFEIAKVGYYNFNNQLIEDLTSSTQINGTEVTVTDGTSGTGVFDISVVSPQLSTSGSLQSGSYLLEAGNISKTSPNFSNTIILQGNLNVIPKALIASVNSSKTKVYDGNDKLLNLTLTLNTPITGDVVLASAAGTYDSKDAGTRNYTVSGITLSGSDADNYFIQGGANAAITSTDGEITPRTLIVTPDADQTKVFGELDPRFTYTNSGAVNGETPGFSGTLSREIGEDVGSYQITQGSLATQNNGVFLTNNYEPSFTEGVDFTITSKLITDAAITTTSIADLVYTGQAQTPTLAVKDGTTVLTQATDYTLSYVDNINVGTATVIITGIGNYNGTKTVTFTITKASLTITADDKSKEFGAADPTLTASYAGFVNGEGQEDLSGTLSISRVTGEAAGTYAISASGLNSSNYAITFTAGRFTITSKLITDTAITVAPISDLIYNGSLQRPKLVVEDGSNTLKEGRDYTLSYSNNINVGTATVTLSGIGNYAADREINFTILPKSINILIADQEKDYGAQDPVLVFTADPNLFGADAFTGTLTRESGEAVGTYLITSGTLSAGDNYTLDIQTDAIFSIIRIDSDGDGVADDIEEADGTDATDSCDFVISSQTETPSEAWNNADCDNDGVTNAEEVIDGTNSLKADSDGDGVIDGTEKADGTDATSFCSSIPSNITLSVSQDYLAADCDGDGLSNGDEIGLDASNPIDSDNDGVADYLEVNKYEASIEDDLEVYNLLTPNGDGENDVFVIRNIELYPENTIEIFNRWGVQVYSVAGYGQNGNYFEGVSNGRGTVSSSESLPTGTYFYILKYKKNGDMKERKGYIYLTK